MSAHDARPEEQAAWLCRKPWRVGRRVGRNVYAQLGPDADDGDVIIGQFDNAALAAAAVDAHNLFLAKNNTASA